MAELLVTGPHESQKLRIPLDERRVLMLGRAERADLSIPWDRMISREHAEVRFHGEKLQVRRLPNAHNPILFRNQDIPQFELKLGEEFQIGNTTFRLMEPEPVLEDEKWLSGLSSPELLQRVAFQNAGRWLEVLSRLPETIAESASNVEFAQRVVSMLLQTLPRVDTAAVLQLRDQDPASANRIQTLCWDSRESDKSRFQPSRTMVKESLQRQESLIHIWTQGDSEEAERSNHYTYSGRFDWAFCVPITEDASWGWCLYLSGDLDCENLPIVESQEELREELRFAELLARFIGALRELRSLENRQAWLGQFFSPAIRATLADMGSESALKPQESNISALFCELRTPSAKGGSSSGGPNELSAFIDQNFRVMSECIFQSDGVMSDFQGDSAMAFWGWPIPTRDGPLPACRTALALRRARAQDPKLAGLRLGCGIAHGPAIAGRIGPDDQCKLGVFGPVVNLGARLKSMARQIRASILIDEPTAMLVRERLPRSEGRCRRIGRFRPQGMDEAATVYELLLPAALDPTISDQHLADFEAATEAITAGRWREANTLLHSLPSTDACKRFLILMIALSDYEPPPQWDGVFSLLSK